MEQSTFNAITAGVGIVSLIVAISAAGIAGRASRSAAQSARAADIENQLGHAARLASWEPSVDMVLAHVEYRWASDASVCRAGQATTPKLPVSGGVTVSYAEAEHVQVEVVISGSLRNRKDTESLATIHATYPRQRWFSLQNQAVFLVKDEQASRVVIPANTTISFKWVDRMPLTDWLLHWVAADERRIGDKKVALPKAAFSQVLRLALRGEPSPRAAAQARRLEPFRRLGGFRVTVERRAAERVSEIWTAILDQSPVVPARETAEGQQWGLSPAASAPIDDDIVRYRCATDLTLAQLNPIGVRLVPGRL